MRLSVHSCFMAMSVVLLAYPPTRSMSVFLVNPNLHFQGFSTNSTPWLPANPNYWWLNVEAQKSADTSHLKVFKALAEARKDPVLMYGDWNVAAPDNDTLIVTRSYNGSYFVLIINMGSAIQEFNCTSLLSSYGLPSDLDMKVVVASVNTGLSTGKKLSGGSVSLRPKGAVLLKSSASRLLSSLSFWLLALLILLHLRV